MAARSPSNPLLKETTTFRIAFGLYTLFLVAVTLSTTYQYQYYQRALMSASLSPQATSEEDDSLAFIQESKIEWEVKAVTSLAIPSTLKVGAENGSFSSKQLGKQEQNKEPTGTSSTTPPKRHKYTDRTETNQSSPQIAWLMSFPNSVRRMSFTFYIFSNEYWWTNPHLNLLYREHPTRLPMSLIKPIDRRRPIMPSVTIPAP